MKTTQFLVSGRVQGVGYRRFVQVQAQSLKISGWTRNLYDGRVEVWAQAAPEVLTAFTEKLRQGPNQSMVEQVEAREIESDKIIDFQIKPDSK